MATCTMHTPIYMKLQCRHPENILLIIWNTGIYWKYDKLFAVEIEIEIDIATECISSH